MIIHFLLMCYYSIAVWFSLISLCKEKYLFFSFVVACVYCSRVLHYHNFEAVVTCKLLTVKLLDDCQ